MPGTWVPRTDTLTSIPSSPSELLSRSPFELEDEELLGRPPVGIELSEDDAVAPGLELLEPEDRDALDELEADGIEGEPELEELEADGMDGELELELDEDDEGMDGIEEEELELEDEDGIDGDELLELELEEDAVGIDGDELELLLWLVSVLHAASTRLRADTVKNPIIGKRAAGLFMVSFRVLLMVYLCRVRLIVLHQALILTGPAIRRFHPQIRGSGSTPLIANKRQVKTLNYPVNPGFSSLMTKP